MHKYANPQLFLSLTRPVVPVVGGLAALLFAVGLYMAFFVAPPDYQQGDTVRIMFVHVPSAWMAMFAYTLIAVSSLVYLVWKHPLADTAAMAAAPLGAGFTAICLITGSLWGQPMWGTWWVWDARLTSVLLLFFLYIGYMALRHAMEEPVRAARAAAVLALVGFVNVPIIKFSVDWWNTLHQPASVSRLDAPAIHMSILIPLLVMAAAFMALFVTLLLIRIHTEIHARRLRSLRIQAAEAAETADPAPATGTGEAVSVTS